MTELWLPVPNFEGLYEVSNGGQCRSLDRLTFGRNDSTRTTRGRALRPRVNPKNGYVQFVLSKDARSFYLYAHRMVLEAFVGPAPEEMEACHGNGIRDDNRVENLRWDTRSNNHADKLAHGTMSRYKSELTHCPQGHPYAGDNLYTSPSGARSCRECGRAHSRKYYRLKMARESE